MEQNITYSITEEEFKLFQNLIQKICGISLDKDKAYLIETRMGALMKEIGVKTYGELYRIIMAQEKKYIPKLISLITTNETFWFRDEALWDFLKNKIIPEYLNLIRSGKKDTIRIWSAASSTGQEAYSLAILIKEITESEGLNSYFKKFSILGVDISEKALKVAQGGSYNVTLINRGLSPSRIKKFFDLKDNFYVIKDDIRSILQFKYHNLIDNFNYLGKFDLVLCRNVAIYFNMDLKIKLFESIKNVLYPESYLILGSTETLLGYSEEYNLKKYKNISYYQLKA